MSQAAMLIYPTLVDVSPNVVKEAVVAGLPVVASAVGGITDYVLPTRTGCCSMRGTLLAVLKQSAPRVDIPSSVEGWWTIQPSDKKGITFRRKPWRAGLVRFTNACGP